MSFFSISEYTEIDVGWGFATDPTGVAYSAPQAFYSWFQGAASRQEGNGGQGRNRERGKGEGGEREWGREGKGEVGGIAPWLLGDRRP